MRLKLLVIGAEIMNYCFVVWMYFWQFSSQVTCFCVDYCIYVCAHLLLCVTFRWLFLQTKKKNRRTAEFWKTIADAVGGHSGEEVERLLKNLQMDYQKVKMHLHLSGSETSARPLLRNSSQIFELYDIFYHQFYPQGGSALPMFVMTERYCNGKCYYVVIFDLS